MLCFGRENAGCFHLQVLLGILPVRFYSVVKFVPLVNQNSSEINEVHTETSHFPGGEWGGREEEVVNAAGSIGGNLQMASIGCMRETCGSVGPGLSEVCHSALLLPSPPSCRTVVRCMCVMLDLSGIATCSKWFSWESSVSPVSRKCLRNPVH